MALPLVQSPLLLVVTSLGLSIDTEILTRRPSKDKDPDTGKEKYGARPFHNT